MDAQLLDFQRLSLCISLLFGGNNETAELEA